MIVHLEIIKLLKYEIKARKNWNIKDSYVVYIYICHAVRVDYLIVTANN